ncbi:MAG: FRG domain-containing protein, partial [bacterium]|nr:FRG domain-containing protein [bacterium]
FTDIVTLVESLQRGKDAPLWFRGCGKSDYKLLPALYRHPTRTKIADIARLEGELITRFRQRSIPFHNRALADDWDTLFFMQHYGVPTRLLDWTENPFVGLYFAVMAAPYLVSPRGRLRFSHAAAMWILDPVVWNRHSLNHQSFDGGVLVPGDDALKGYRPTPSFSGMYNHPVALYGAHNSSRIVAQRGVFTIFGQNTIPMEKAFVTEGFPQDSLIKVTLTRNFLPEIRRSVLMYGTTESVVFPDLEGLSREIKRTFGFEV